MHHLRYPVPAKQYLYGHRQCFHSKSETKTIFTHPVFFRHFHILEHNAMRIATPDT